VILQEARSAQRVLTQEAFTVLCFYPNPFQRCCPEPQDWLLTSRPDVVEGDRDRGPIRVNCGGSRQSESLITSTDVVRIESVRRLAVLTSAMAIFETLLYSALAPLLPSFKDELGFSKAQAGLLVATYAIGLSVAALPVGLLASRMGVKRAALAGLVILAVTSVGFGLVDNFGALLATRFLQGAAGALCWSSGIAWLVDASPRERRGEMIGIFSGAGAAGHMLGPAVGGLAVLVGRAGVFAGMAGVAFVLAIIGTRFPSPARGERQSLALIKRTHSSGVVLSGQLLVAVPGVLLGTIGVLGPLRLSHLGWGPVGIAGTFFVAAAIGVLTRPVVGRWADRRGRLGAVRLLLLAAIPLTLVISWLGNRWLLAVLVVSAISVYGLLWAPVMAHLSSAYEETGVAQALGFALMSLSAGVGIIAGSAVGGEIAHLAGDATAYGLTAATCLVTFFVLAVHNRHQLVRGSAAALKSKSPY
jgi:MFS family permease